MINPDDGQWLTYREAAVVSALTPEGVRSLARRKGWLRQTPNEIGVVARVLLPTGLHRRERPDPTDATTRVARRDTVAPPSGLPSRDLSEEDKPGKRCGSDRAGFLAGEERSRSRYCASGWPIKYPYRRPALTVGRRRSAA